MPTFTPPTTVHTLTTPYGLELLLDLSGCQFDGLSRDKLTAFFVELCDLIEMRPHGEPLFWEDYSGIPHLHGISAVQFIETSTMVVHPLPLLGMVFINVFSCKPFDATTARDYCKAFWKAAEVKETVVVRGQVEEEMAL